MFSLFRFYRFDSELCTPVVSLDPHVKTRSSVARLLLDSQLTVTSPNASENFVEV